MVGRCAANNTIAVCTGKSDDYRMRHAGPVDSIAGWTIGRRDERNRLSIRVRSRSPVSI
jgi:hypothetical protein